MELKIEGVSKTYGNKVKALQNINLTISSGMFGLLGPNGAGKSTLMRTIATLQEPDSGSITFGRLNVLRDKNAVRKTLGYLPQEFGLYPRTTCEDLLNHLAMLKGITKNGERKRLVASMLKLTNLYQHRKKALGGFSGGMKQRFGIAQALIANPELLIVDEPTAGLDPEERLRFYNILSEIGEQTIVILSTHIVSDVNELCSDMAIINNGRLLLHKKPLEAVTELRGRIWSRSITKERLDYFKERYDVISTRQFAGKMNIHIYSTTPPEEGFEPSEPDLHDVYFNALSSGNGVEQ